MVDDMALLGSDDYSAIRKAISASLDSDTLPGETIGDDLYLKSAIEWVAARTTDMGEHAKRAGILFCAHLLVPAVYGQILAAHTIKTGTATSGQFKWKDLSDTLLARAEAEIALISGVSVPEARRQNLPPKSVENEFIF
jgi:hypothetical protein